MHHGPLVREGAEAGMTVIAPLPARANAAERKMRVHNVEQSVINHRAAGGSLTKDSLGEGLLLAKSVECQRLASGMNEGQYVIQRIIREHRQHRTKDFLAHDAHGRSDAA